MKMRFHGHNLMFHHCYSASSTDKENAFNNAVATCNADNATEAYNYIKDQIPGGFSMLHVVRWGNGFRSLGGGPAYLCENKDGKFSAAILF